MNTCENCKESKKTRSFGRLYGEDKTTVLNEALDIFDEAINKIKPHSKEAMALAVWFNAYKNNPIEASVLKDEMYIINEFSDDSEFEFLLEAINSITDPCHPFNFELTELIVEHARISMLKSRIVHSVFLGFK